MIGRQIGQCFSQQGTSALFSVHIDIDSINILILTDNVVDDTVDIVPGEHLPGERELYGEKPFRLELNTFAPELDLINA